MFIGFGRTTAAQLDKTKHELRLAQKNIQILLEKGEQV